MLSPEWRLGGADRFVRAVAADLGDGICVALVLPRRGVPDGLQLAVREQEHLRDIDVNHLSLDELEAFGGRVIDGLYGAFSLQRDDSGERVHADDLVRHPGLGRRLVWVDVRGADRSRADAWGEFLGAYAHASGEVPPPLRTVFVTLCDGRQAAVIPDTDRVVTRWWWGVLGQLDTAVYVDQSLDGRRRMPAFAEMVTEVAGFDLRLAAVLIEDWDGSFETLRPLLGEFLTEPAGEVSAEGRRPRPDRPHVDLVEPWSAGLVNAWGESNPHLHPCHLAGDEKHLRHLVWRGQVRGLIPKIELERQKLASWVHERREDIPSQVPEWQRRDLFGLEVGPLSELIAAAPRLVQHEREVNARAQWLRTARNKISHLEIVGREELDEARELFES